MNSSRNEFSYISNHVSSISIKSEPHMADSKWLALEKEVEDDVKEPTSNVKTAVK